MKKTFPNLKYNFSLHNRLTISLVTTLGGSRTPG